MDQLIQEVKVISICGEDLKRQLQDGGISNASII